MEIESGIIFTLHWRFAVKVSEIAITKYLEPPPIAWQFFRTRLIVSWYRLIFDSNCLHPADIWQFFYVLFCIMFLLRSFRFSTLHSYTLFNFIQSDYWLLCHSSIIKFTITLTYCLNFGTPPSITFKRLKLETSCFFFVRSTVESSTQWMMNDPKGGV